MSAEAERCWKSVEQTNADLSHLLLVKKWCDESARS